MGTNYYADNEGDCPTCTRTHVCQVHLGKSSFGWKFCFALNGGEYYKSVAELKEWLKGRKIYNEYYEPVSYDEFWEVVEAKQSVENPDDTHTTNINGYRFLDGDFS